MRRYECIIIVDSEISEKKLSTIFDKISNEIESSEGLLIKVDDWGEKKLAYEIKRKFRGRYLYFDFCSAPGLITKIENYFKINDNVLKYMTVVLDRNVDMELLKEEKAEIDKVDLAVEDGANLEEGIHNIEEKKLEEGEVLEKKEVEVNLD